MSKYWFSCMVEGDPSAMVEIQQHISCNVSFHALLIGRQRTQLQWPSSFSLLEMIYLRSRAPCLSVFSFPSKIRNME